MSRVLTGCCVLKTHCRAFPQAVVWCRGGNQGDGAFKGVPKVYLAVDAHGVLV